MKKVLFMVAIAAALGSCTKNETPQAPNNSGDLITFNPYSSNATKAETTNTSIQTSGWGVYGYFHDDAAYDWTTDPATAKPNFMYNQKITYSSGWTYTPPKYWSNDANDRYSFFGYAPYADGTYVKVKSLNDAVGVPVITYTLNTADPKNSVDFVAGQITNVDKASHTGSDGVTINMKHQLTRLGFEAKSTISDDATTSIVVRSITLAGASTLKTYTSADYKFATDETTGTANDHDQDGRWDVSAGTQATIDISTLLAKDNKAFGSYPELIGKEIPANSGAWVDLFGTGDNYQYVIPPNGSTGLATGSGLQLTINYDIVTADGAVQNGYTHSSNQVIIPLADGALKQGVSYNYQITFTLTKVVLTPNVVAWDSAGDVTGTGTETSGVPTTIPTPAP